MLAPYRSQARVLGSGPSGLGYMLSPVQPVEMYPDYGKAKRGLVLASKYGHHRRVGVRLVQVLVDLTDHCQIGVS